VRSVDDVTARPDPADRAIKQTRLRAILAATGAERLALTSHAAVSWYLDGARTHVSLAGDPVLAVLIGPTGDTVITPGSERARLAAEELPTGVRIREVDWQAPLSSAWADDPRVLAESDVAAPLRAARAQLLPAELERFRALGRDTATVLTDVLSAADPGRSEIAVTAAVGARLLEQGIDPLVLLAAGRSRLGNRHPLPTTAPLGDRAMVVVCARRHGLIANLTRWVRFGEPNPAETDATARILEVEAAYFTATRPGAAVSEVLERGSAAYGAHGFADDEWRRHHQGGPAGYNGRDPRAVAGLPDRVQAGQAFAWNPSAPGAKVEDTVLIGSEPRSLEVLTVDPRWPSTLVHGVARPTELIL
jgi:Xaa-Pro aminopeptidase